MRTRITCGWLVAHADGHHTLWRNAELVYEGNTVLFVGERFEGAVDREMTPAISWSRPDSSTPMCIPVTALRTA